MACVVKSFLLRNDRAVLSKWPRLFGNQSDQWSTGEPNWDNIQKKHTAKNVKRINWENKSLFGPMLKTRAEKKEKVEPDKKSFGKSRPSVTVSIRECGYDTVEGPAIDRRTIVKTTVADGIEMQNLIQNEEDLVSKKHRQQNEPGRVKESAVDTQCKVDKLTGESLIAKEAKEAALSPIKTTPSPTVQSRDDVKTLSTFPLMFQSLPRSEAATDWLSEHWKVNPNENFFPSVSSVLQQTMSEESVLALEKWEKRMILKLGEEGFKSYKQEIFDVGSTFHRCIKDYLTGSRDISRSEIDDNVKPYWKSLRPILARVTDASLLEVPLKHPILHYCGVVDCVAHYKDVATLIEWKTSQRPKPNLDDTYDNPLQAVAYLGALPFRSNFDLKVNSVAIVVAYSTGHPAHVHYLNQELCEYYWNLWLQRLHKFLVSKEGDKNFI